MEVKKCNKCNIDKEISDFNIKKDSKDGYSSYCKLCKKEIDSNYYSINKVKVCLKNKEYRTENSDKIKESKNIRKDKIKISKKKYRDNNKEKIYKYNKEYFLVNKDILSEKHKEYMKKYILTKEYKEIKKREYLRNKEINKHILIWRNTLNSTLIRLNKSKEGKTIDLLGYSPIELKEHLEKLFTDGMSWDNYGEWHIDHIIGVINFDVSTPVNIVNALSNLRPMWATTREINGVIYEGNLNRIKKQ
jgi:hypothetical protein